MNDLKLALIGECMIELQETAPGVTSQTFGGDTLNTAIYCARLGRRLPLAVDYVTALGTDRFSDRMVEFWEREGVGSSRVLRQPGEMPGLYYIELEPGGERIFHYWRSAAAAKKCFEYPASPAVLDALAGYDGIYLSGISLAILTPVSRARLIDRLEEVGGGNTAVYFDGNFRPHLWGSVAEAKDACGRLFGVCDIVFMTAEEAMVLLDTATAAEAHAVLRQAGVGESVLKDGAGPCTIATPGGIESVEAETVSTVVDTTAAGDSFSAVYLVARLFGCAPAEAARLAHRAAAYVIRHRGAIAPVEQMPVTGETIRGCRQ